MRQWTPERQEAWCQALESGKYLQGKGALRTDDGRYCCLGVLCVVENVGEYEIQRYNVSSGSLVTGVGDLYDDVRHFLISLNDGHPGLKGEYSLEARQYSFSEIAALIRKHVDPPHGEAEVCGVRPASG